MTWGLAVLLLLPFSSLGGEIVIGIAEVGGGSAPSWARVCLANGFTKLPAVWPAGPVVTKSSITNALILLEARSVGGDAVEVEAVNAIDGHTIWLERFNPRSLHAENMSKTLNSVLANPDLPGDHHARVAVSVVAAPGVSPKQEELSFSFRTALATATNTLLLPDTSLRSLAVGLQDLVMANIIKLGVPVVGRMLPAEMVLKPDMHSKTALSYTAIDTMSGRSLGSVEISGASDIPKALARIPQYRAAGDAERQGGEY